jgi:hypothetical protein
MADFPLLKTGAVVQYPVTRGLQFSTHVLRFLDGAEQRFREYKNALRRWGIRLDLLDEQELARLEDFFVSIQGRMGTFSFIDPWDGVEYPNCSLEKDCVEASARDQANGAVTMIVKQNRD